jgi:hypothetical protein
MYVSSTSTYRRNLKFHRRICVFVHIYLSKGNPFVSGSHFFVDGFDLPTSYRCSECVSERDFDREGVV